MPDQSEHNESAAVHRSKCLSLLRSLQNPDGGWGFLAGGQSRVEPTCWAALCLSQTAKPDDQDNHSRLIEFLHSHQLADGSLAMAPGMSAGGWVSSLACLALAGHAESDQHLRAGLSWICEDFPRDSSPWQRFMRVIRPDSHLAAQDDSLRGWGWTPKTSSWVEPTSFALMALGAAKAEQLPKTAGQRRDLATSLLYDRMCPGGGWNCGNPRVYGVDGDSLVLPTCWALLALRDAPERPGRALSLAWLQRQFSKIESAGSLAVARMTLENYGMPAPQAKRDLLEWTAQELGAEGVHVLAWAGMALDPSRRWPAVSQLTLAGAAR